MPVVTEQELEDAAIDVATLEAFLNNLVTTPNPGQANGTVTSRLGQTYPVLAKVIETVLATDITAQRFFVPLQSPTGTANAITAAPNVNTPIIAGGADQWFMIRWGLANTSSTVTLAIPGVDGGAARFLRTNRNKGIEVGALVPGKIGLVKHDPTNAVYELIYPAPHSDAVVECDVGGSANALTMQAAPGYAVVGTRQTLRGRYVGVNSGNVTLAVTDAYGGVATAVKLPSGLEVPPGGLANCTIEVRQNGAAWELVAPTFVPSDSAILTRTTSTTGAVVATIVPAAVKLDAFGGTGIVFSCTMVADKSADNGSSIELRRADGSLARASSPFYDADGVTHASWKKDETIYFELSPTTFFFYMKRPADPVTEPVTKLISSQQWDMPPSTSAVMVTHASPDRWEVVNGKIVYDDPRHKRNNGDHHALLIRDTGADISASVLKSSTAFTSYAHMARVRGARWDVGNLASNSIGNGLYDAIQASTNEFGMRFGLTTDAISSTYPNGKLKREFYGFGHGDMQLIPGTAFLKMESSGPYTGVFSESADLKSSMKTTAVKRGRRARFYAEYDVYRATYAGVTPIPIRQGKVTVEHDVKAGEGEWLYQIHKVGRELAYTNGSGEIFEGNVITWAGGGQAEVVYIPGHDATGTWGGGNRAGTMYVRAAVGPALVAGVDLLVGGVVKAKAGGAVGPQVTGQQSITGALTATCANFAKVPGYPEFRIDGEDDVDRPLGFTFTVGAVEIVEGKRYRGVTSGKIGIVEYVPPVNNTTGTWVGGNRTGYVFCSRIYDPGTNLNSLFTAGEDLQELGPGDVPIAGVVAKVGTSFQGLPMQSRFQTWHSDSADADGDVVIFEVIAYRLIGGVWTEDACSLDGPATDAFRPQTFYVDCRSAEGVRKYYPIWDATSGAPTPMEGVYVGRHLYRVRRGKPV